MTIALHILAKMQYFKGLGHEEIKIVKEYVAFEKKIEKGDMLLFEGDHSEYIYFVVSGVVKVFKEHANGKEQILNIAGADDSLNDVSTFDGGGSAANMLAITPVHYYALKMTNMEKLFRENKKIARNVARVLASRVRRDSSLVEVLSFGHVMSRLAGLILKQIAASKDGRLPPFTQYDLAAMVGTSRVVVNRLLRTMEEKGAIRLVRRHIVVMDKTTLEKLVI
jgi:CRP-like cAMP-binding protein